MYDMYRPNTRLPRKTARVCRWCNWSANFTYLCSPVHGFKHVPSLFGCKKIYRYIRLLQYILFLCVFFFVCSFLLSFNLKIICLQFVHYDSPFICKYKYQYIIFHYQISTQKYGNTST